MKRTFLTFTLIFTVTLALPLGQHPVKAGGPVRVKLSRKAIEGKWMARIQMFLDRGTIPLVDLLSFLPREKTRKVLCHTNRVMDETGVALISFAGYEASGDADSLGYRWGYFIHEVVNEYPDRFILTTNKGGNGNWWKEKGGKPRHFIDQLEAQVRGGDYPFIGQIEFRHYMSTAQCKAGRTHREIDIPINGKNGHRVFRLSAQTGIPFSIHLEPEDEPISALEEMLGKYPEARVIWTHFGQIRQPDKEKRFGPEMVVRLLDTFPNLYFDISTGEPGRRYACGQDVLDTVIWKTTAREKQANTLKPAYKKILERFSDRFVVGFDFGPPNRQNEPYLRQRIENARLIIRDLSEEARHNISYRNAWFLLTGRPWQEKP